MPIRPRLGIEGCARLNIVLLAAYPNTVYEAAAGVSMLPVTIAGSDLRIRLGVGSHEPDRLLLCQFAGLNRAEFPGGRSIVLLMKEAASRHAILRKFPAREGSTRRQPQPSWAVCPYRHFQTNICRWIWISKNFPIDTYDCSLEGGPTEPRWIIDVGIMTLSGGQSSPFSRRIKSSVTVLPSV